MDRPSLFERHSRSTLLALTSVSLVVILVATEYLFESFLSTPPPKRYIRLREYGPLQSTGRKVDREVLGRQYHLIVDGLEERFYPFRTDKNGFIVPSEVHDKPDLTLAFLGGSTTECRFVDEESRFAYRAGALLEQRLGLKVNSYNAGFRGSNTMHLIDVLLNKLIAFRPDIVVLMENVNDVNILLFDGSHWNDNRARSLVAVESEGRGRWERFAQAFGDEVFPGIATRLRNAGVFKNGTDEFEIERSSRKLFDVPEKVFAANLAVFVEICRANGITPVLMTQFNRFKDVPDETTARSMKVFEKDWGLRYAGYKGLVDSFNESIRSAGRGKGVLTIDLDRRVPKEKEYLYDIVHLNTAGSKLVSEIVAEELARNEEVRKRAGAAAPATPSGAREG